MDTTLRYKLNFDVDRAHEAAHIKELHTLINRLEGAAQKKNNFKVEKGNSKASE